MDEAAVVRQQVEVPVALSPPPPLPEKDEQSLIGEEDDGVGRMSSEVRSTLDLDADVALWKSSGGGGAAAKEMGQRRVQSSCFTGSSDRGGGGRERGFGSVDTESTSDHQQNYQMIPDYNLAYEAEDAVARRIADERARAARRLEGISTPYGMSRSSAYDDVVDHQRQLHQPIPVVASVTVQQQPCQDLERNEKSHWSITTPSNELEMPVPQPAPPPPPPPPKDEQEQMISSPRPPMLTLSERVQSLRSSRPSTRPASVVSSTRSSRLQQHSSPPQTNQQPQLQPEPMMMMMHPPPPVISTDEIKTAVKETLEDHSHHQAPMFDEMVTLLRSQDQVSQATVMNQAEVSRYLTQLNSHLEGVLQKKSEDVEVITQSVRQLQDQLSMLLEQSSRIAAVAPEPPVVVVEQASPDIDRGLMEGGGESEEGGGEAEQQAEEDQQGIHFEVEEGADVDVNVEIPDEPGRHVSSMTKRPSASQRLGGPRARKISLAGKSLRGPRMPTTLANVGKLWGGPTPAADRAARWGGGGTLKRAPTGKSAMTATGEPVNVEGALAGLSGDESGRETGDGGGGDADERTGTIAMGVSHILKLLRENQTKEEARRKQKEIEKASQPKSTIPNEMEERRAKIEELQLRREATLADDKAKNMEAIMIAMRQQAAEHDRLLKQIVEEMGKRRESGDEEEEQRRRHEESMEGVNRVLTTVESGVMTHLEEFKAQMFAEMKQTFEKVGELRDQKQQIQSDIADMLCFMSKVRGGGPDPRWQYPISSSSIPPGSMAGSVAGGDHGMGPPGGYAPIPTVYPTPHMDYAERRDLGPEMETKSTAGFGPRPPGRR